MKGKYTYHVRLDAFTKEKNYSGSYKGILGIIRVLIKAKKAGANRIFFYPEK